MSISNNLRVVRLLDEAKKNIAEATALNEQAREAVMNAECYVRIARAILEKAPQ